VCNIVRLLRRRTASSKLRKSLHALGERGIDPGRLRAEGLGSDRPVASNDEEDQRAQNRRVELHIEETHIEQRAEP